MRCEFLQNKKKTFSTLLLWPNEEMKTVWLFCSLKIKTEEGMVYVPINYLRALALENCFSIMIILWERLLLIFLLIVKKYEELIK
jgi:hypothetical protein